MILQRASAKVFIIAPRWGTSLKNHFLAKSWRCNVCKGENFEGEREEKRGGGWNFGRSVAGKKMRKEGFGCSGITPRCGEWETGIQKDRESRQRDSSISF